MDEQQVEWQTKDDARRIALEAGVPEGPALEKAMDFWLRSMADWQRRVRTGESSPPTIGWQRDSWEHALTLL